MSVLQRRVSSFEVANVLISATMLVSTGACYHSPSAAPQPGEMERSERRALATAAWRLRSFPGVDVVPMGQSAFIVKNHSAMVGDGEPLYVIDGNPMTIDPNRGITWIKPDDIAQIKVLKSTGELAIYGPRGVNGVIVITTKQGLGQ